MESKLDNVLDSMMQTENTIGVLIADNQGLSYGTRGVANSQAGGLITAIADQAAKIHPNLDAPVIILETENTSVTISKYGFHTGAIYKRKSQSKK
ncbi:hypothetical protein PVAND_009863 [Polypedilum vanderplanki]|uniref:Late endosomal/lysosomal adaptor and MAPK and MTOR activator 5 n=1 Tax=Polypedilum vanderplanki TaxID=319348 RepID=A0A9J6CDU8_POLVA|nr:hypothetical protein PVAND_009863 [Polypedilum vanderplanki]